MFGNNKKTIGVFVTKAEEEFQRTLCKGISMRANELDYNVAFFANFLRHSEPQYEAGERNIVDLPTYESFDGIILLPDSMYDLNNKTRIIKNIKKYCNCPVVNVCQKIDEYYNVTSDDNLALEEIIRHFIVYHGYRKINILTGPKENSVARERLDTYKRILQEYQIPIEEDRIYYGDFWKVTPRDAVELWVSNPDMRPEAIICANDQMAVAVCRALAERGISVPEEIAVSGYDNNEITKDYNPTITTAGLPVLEMGIVAVDKIYKHLQGIEQEKDTYMNTVMKIRESCGCKQNGSREVMLSRRNNILDEMEAKDKDISDNAFMSAELTGVKTLEDLDRKLACYTGMNEGFSSFYMCLNKNWDICNDQSISQQSDVNHMIIEVGIKNGEWLKKVEISKPSLLGDFQAESEPQNFFFNILHYQEVYFGYTAISFNRFEVYRNSYQGWLINISNTLENIRIHNELNRLVFKLEDMSIKDALTDLYNRRALEILGEKYLQQCIDEQSKLMVFTADMDKLKFINDNYGHGAGDIAIKVVADALKTAAEDDEICMRVGGDEFTVIGIDYDHKKMDNFIRKFESEIERFNATGSCDFKVFVSYGWSIIKPNKYISIEDCLIVADSKMYQQKYEKEAIRLKHQGNFKELEEDK